MEAWVNLSFKSSKGFSNFSRHMKGASFVTNSLRGEPRVD